VCQLGLSSLAGLTLLDLTACGSSSSSTTAGANETMQLSFWGDASRGKLTSNAIKAFTQDGHPNIAIKPWSADFSSYFNKLNTQIAGGSSPDLIQMDMSYVQQYVKNHILLDMTPLLSNKAVDLSDFDQGLLANSKDNQIIYGIPLGGNYECMIYDTTIIQEAGVNPPPASWTWDEFAAYTGSISKALASKKIYGTHDASGAMDMFEIWVRQRGRELYTTDGKVAFTADDVSSWFSYWDQLRKAGACAPAQLQATVTGSGPAVSLLAKGKAAFTTGHSNQFNGYQVLTKHPLALQSIPTGQAPGNFLKPSMLMSIAANSKFVDDAAKFINFLITNPAGVKAIGLDRGIPGSAKARAALNPTLKAADKAVLAYADLVASSGQSSPRTVLDPAGAGKILTDLGTISQAVGFGKTSITAAATTFYQNAQKTLSQA